jgi:outer membrane protein OmpA-like peptidoglycan-associated protein
MLIGSASLWPMRSHAQAQRNTLDTTNKHVTASEIADALKPKVLRSLGPAAPKENTAIVALTFETGSVALTNQSKAMLREFAKAFKDYMPGVAVIIEGHADPRGGDEYNLKLSENRANSVRAYLASLGNDPKQFEIVGFGQTRLMDPAIRRRNQSSRRIRHQNIPSLAVHRARRRCRYPL